MTERERFIKDLRELADRDLPGLIELPQNNVGLPDGSFIPKSFLNYLADALESKIS